MMMNCPNCNLLQPKDQYCAGCGVNMETWTPPKKPFLKEMMGNWMVQLAGLFLMILGVVAWDSFSDQISSTDLKAPPPLSSQVQKKPLPAPPPLKKSQNNSRAKPSPAATLKGKKAASPAPRVQAPSPSSPQVKSPQLRKKLSLQMSSMGRGVVENLSQWARKIDEGIFLMTGEKARAFTNENRGSMGGLSRPALSSFEFGEPVEVFLGEVDEDTGVSVGFFAQITVNEKSTPQDIKALIRFWHQLKLSDEPTAPLTFEVRMKSQDSLYIVDSTLRDMEFTNEENSLFESSSKLKGLNNEAFRERLSDIVALIEIK